MAHEVRGVVATAKKAPVTVETITVPDPGPGEALVRVKACGVCHTDLHYREGGINDDFPFLLGHEAAGTIEAVGDGVTSVAPATTSSSPGGRRAGPAAPAAGADPGTASPRHNASQKMTLAAPPLSPALGIGAFAELTLVHAGQCVTIDPRARPEAAGLIGCGVMAGFGAALTPAACAGATPWPSSAAAEWATPPSPPPPWPAPAPSSPWTSTPRSSSGPRASAPPTP